MSRFNQIKTFVQVVESNSFAGASKVLKISTAAVSKQISNLENELSVQLLNRSTRHISLTEAGANFLEHCKRIIRDMEIAESALSQIKEVPSGTVEVVTGNYFGNTFLIPHLKEFFEHFPDIKLNIEFNERIPSFQDEAIDVVVGMSVSADDDVIQRRIDFTRYMICASPEYLKTYGTPTKPKDLVNHRYVTHSIRKPDNIIKFRNGQMLEVEPWLRFNNSQPIVECIKSGLCIGMVLEYAAREAVEKGELVEILKPFIPDHQPIYLSYKHSRFVPAKIRSFIDFFIKKINPEA